MKIAIITDQHFGCRKNSKLFHDYFLEFYKNVFFPTLEKEGITTVINMGDTFDSRKGIDFAALTWAKDNYFDRLKEMGVTVHTIVGNHDVYYKNTNDINAIDLLLREYDNIPIYSETTSIVVDGLNKIDGISCAMPKGAFYAFPNVEGTGMSSSEFANRVLEEAGVALLAGESFGKYGTGHIRISFANSAENLRTAIDRIQKFVESN